MLGRRAAVVEDERRPAGRNRVRRTERRVDTDHLDHLPGRAGLRHHGGTRHAHTLIMARIADALACKPRMVAPMDADPHGADGRSPHRRSRCSESHRFISWYCAANRAARFGADARMHSPVRA